MFTTAHGVLLMCWILYCVVHSVLAAASFKQWIARQAGAAFRYYRAVYSIFATLSLAALLSYHFSFPPAQLGIKGILFQYAGWMFMFTGGCMMAICIRKYFFNLSGIDVFFRKEKPETPTLEVKGLHQLTRHPLYLGTLLFSWGWFLVWPFPHHLIANVVMTIYVMIAISWEEKKLIQEYGNAYKEYASKVPRLIPWKFKM